MRAGARTPEELEVLFEDAFLTWDRAAVADLFEERAILAVGADGEVGRGVEIPGLACAIWRSGALYVADGCRVLQAHDMALVLAPAATSVARRGSDGSWRYAISVLDLNNTSERKNR